jgi:hypothetical protein
MMVRNLVCATQKMQHFSSTKISLLTLFRKLIAVYSESDTKPMNTFGGENGELMIIKAGGSCVFNTWVLRVVKLIWCAIFLNTLIITGNNCFPVSTSNFKDLILY